MSPEAVPFAEATRTWLRIGLLSFGGPAGQIAVMHRILVEEKRWISEQRFLHALNYCMVLPGPEAQQLATYVGWLLHGLRGGLVAGLLFVLPGVLVMMALSFVYVGWSGQPLLEGVLLGLKAAVVALVIQALIRIGRRALRDGFSRGLALFALLGLLWLRLPFPLILVAAALAGLLRARFSPAAPAALAPEDAVPSGARAHEPPLTQVAPSAGRTVKLLATWLPLWFLPVAASGLWLSAAPVLVPLSLFFSKMAVVTFGGAYAVLAYVAQQAVDHFAWITPQQMLDGLGLAESTPGPLILVVQFVGFLAAYQHPGDLAAPVAGILGALLTVWVTFVPCFLWIFLGAPYVERLRGHAALAGALSAITAAVVGVIAHLALWFLWHVWFAETTARGFPVWNSVQPVPLVLTVLAVLMLFALRWGLGACLGICTALGAAWTLWA